MTTVATQMISTQAATRSAPKDQQDDSRGLRWFHVTSVVRVAQVARGISRVFPQLSPGVARAFDALAVRGWKRVANGPPYPPSFKTGRFGRGQPLDSHALLGLSVGS